MAMIASITSNSRNEILRTNSVERFEHVALHRMSPKEHRPPCRGDWIVRSRDCKVVHRIMPVRALFEIHIATREVVDH